MGSADRSTIKYLSICGILASLYLLTMSFFGKTIHNTLPIIIGSAVLMIGLGVSLTLDPLIPFWSRNFFFTKFWDGKPPWARPLYLLLFVFLLAQFVLLAMHGPSGIQVIAHHEPLAGADGDILRTYSQAQQLSLNEAALRFVSTLMSLNYYQLLMYSLFPLRNISN